ncbi:MAG: TVP38/TMEM64 family protein [Caulobacterales bacterium]
MSLKRPLTETIFEFVTNLDARAWRAVGVTIGLFFLVGVILLVGRLMYGDEVNQFVETWLGGAERAHWGLPATILIFTVAALVGAPQVVLIGLCVVAFSPETGFWYAWIATIVSGAVTFIMGRVAGTETLKRFSGATGGRFSRFMGQNSFLASFAVRFVPTAPFIVVNMAMGAAGMGFFSFLGGLALGVLPKTAIVAFAGDGVMDFLEGNVEAAIGAAAAAILVWILVVVVIRRYVRRNAVPVEPEDQQPAHETHPPGP